MNSPGSTPSWLISAVRASLSGVAMVLLLGLLAWLAHRGMAAVDAISQEQQRALALAHQLNHFAKENQRIRMLQVQWNGSSSELHYRQLLDLIERQEGVARDLAQRFDRVGFAAARFSLHAYENAARNGAVAAQKLHAVRTRLGIAQGRGVLPGLRGAAEQLEAALMESSPHLAGELRRLERSERELAASLEPEVASTLLTQLEQLRSSLDNKRRSDPTLQAAFTHYRQVVDDTLELIVELRSAEQHNALRYEKLEPLLAATEQRLDQQIALLADAVQRIGAQAKLEWVGAFTVALSFALVMGYWQVQKMLTRQRRLRQLRHAVAQVAEGSAPDPDRLPEGTDDIGALASDVQTMADRIGWQLSTIHRDREKAERTSKAKSAFVANVSHEIRTPLHGGLTTLQLLEQTELTPQQREYLTLLHANCRALVALSDDLLDLSKMEANQLRINREPFLLRGAIQNVIRNCRPRAVEKDLPLTVFIDETAPDELFGDPDRLQQILLNLVVNAIKFTDMGEVEVGVSVEDANADPVRLLFWVRDTGVGIPEEERKDLFQPFVQGDSGKDPRHGGAGLGLAIVNNLVSLMGGTLTLESTVGSGSCFRFELVFPRASEVQQAPSSSATPWSLPHNLAKVLPLRILLVEDNPLNRKALTRVFQRMGYDVELAIEGKEAVARAVSEPFDIIFMDIQMPNLDGIAATQIIRAELGELRHPVIIAMTANASEADRNRCSDAGMDDFICKPFRLEDLVRKLKRWGTSRSHPITDTGTKRPAIPLDLSP